MPNVTQSNFIEESNELIRLLPTAAFVAIDEEMTGINIPNSPRPRKDDTPELRYDNLRAVPEKYSIIQLGICLFHQEPDYTPGASPEFIARKFNFYMFPPSDNRTTREVVLNPSSIAFLNEHNMDFSKWTKEGIPFVTGDTAQTLLENYQTKELARKEKLAAVRNASASYSDRPGQRRVELNRTEDVAFHARAMASLREWLDAPNSTNHPRRPAEPTNVGPQASPEGLSFLMPPTNSFLRRALYESIALEYPALLAENAGKDYPNQIRVLRLNPKEQAAREERLQREAWENLIVHQIGMWRVFMALSMASHGLNIPTDSITFASTVKDIHWDRVGNFKTPSVGHCVPVVVHNGYMDLMFLMTHFHSHSLPPTFAEAKSLIHSYFPVIYDTKFMATERVPAAMWNESTDLEGLFTRIIKEYNEMSHLVWLAPDSADESGFAYLGRESQAHDAAYDAFMTGAVYVGICHHIGQDPIYVAEGRVGSLLHILADDIDEPTAVKVYGRNMLYLYGTIYSVNLESTHDPLQRRLIPEAILRISELDCSATTRTIIHSLSNLRDSQSNRLIYEIIWINDTTFLVAAINNSESGCSAEVAKEYGQCILEALRKEFPTQKIQFWDDYVASLRGQVTGGDTSWMAKLGLFWEKLHMLGYKKSSQEDADYGDKRELELEVTTAEDTFQPSRKRRRIM